MYYLAEVVTNRLETLLRHDIVDVQPIGGGDISDARLIKTQDGSSYFVKTNDRPDALAMFRAEASGLNLLRSAIPDQLYIPEVIGYDEAGGSAFLLLEYLENAAPPADFWPSFGRGLAALHRHRRDQFGLEHDNFIGRLPQSNISCKDWPEFYAGRRLLPQARLAYERQLFDLKDIQQVESLCRKLEDIFPSEAPALIHGDLWNGNYLIHSGGKAVLIDPAVSFSHRELDLAMTKLFGGFSGEFYHAYHEAYPLEAGWEDRLPIGQLYYLLVHLNLFGTSYLPPVKRILKRF